MSRQKKYHAVERTIGWKGCEDLGREDLQIERSALGHLWEDEHDPDEGRYHYHLNQSDWDIELRNGKPHRDVHSTRYKRT